MSTASDTAPEAAARESVQAFRGRRRRRMAAALVVLNFAAAALGGDHPWLVGFDLVLDLAVLGAGVGYIVRHGLRTEARTARMQATLDETQAQLAAIVDSAMDAIITVDEEQRIVLFNRAAETMFGCAAGRGARRDARSVSSRRAFAKRTARTSSGSAETGETRRRMGADLVLWALRADGAEFPIEASISHAGEAGPAALHRDPARHHAAQAGRGRAEAPAGGAARALGAHARGARGREDRASRASCTTSSASSSPR